MDFYETLEKFKPYEIEASKRITNLNNTALLKFCDNYKYDFITTPDMLKFEVKTDVMSLKTNNIFIEFFGYGKPSGISISQSNYYIICDTINYYMIETKILKTFVENNTYKVVSTGNKSTFGYLINKSFIISHSIKI